MIRSPDNVMRRSLSVKRHQKQFALSICSFLKKRDDNRLRGGTEDFRIVFEGIREWKDDAGMIHRYFELTFYTQTNDVTRANAQHNDVAVLLDWLDDLDIPFEMEKTCERFVPEYRDPDGYNYSTRLYIAIPK